MMPRLAACLAVLTMPLLAAGCSNSKPNPTAPNAIVEPGQNPGSIFGDEGILGTFGVGKGPKDTGGGSGIGVNAYLWRGALDTLGFMPLTSADPFGGVIITDWYTSPSATGERFKATAYILGKELRSDGIRVSIFRQVLQNGQWVDAPVSQRTVGDIEDKVLERARKLRDQQTASN